jgi:ketosteroid isomerase-like protein
LSSRAVALLALSLGASALGCASMPYFFGTPREHILHVLSTQEDAWNRGDVEGFMHEGYWESPELTFFSGGDVTTGFEPVLARYQKRYKTEGAEMGKLAFTNLDVVQISDRAAIVRGRWDLDFEQKADVGGLFTLVMRRIDGAWRIVHDHTSVATPG